MKKRSRPIRKLSRFFLRNQAGAALLVVPVILVSLCIVGYQLSGHSHRLSVDAAVQPADSDMDEVQAKLCARQCVALTRNNLASAARRNAPVISSSQACECKSPTLVEPFTCVASFIHSQDVKPIAGLTMITPEVGVAVDCR